MDIDLNEMNRQQLEQLREDIDRALIDLADRERQAAIDAADAAARAHGYTLAELNEVLASAPKKKSTRSRAKGSPKYRNPDNPSQTWPGKGRKPQWIKDAEAAGRPLEDFLI